jgi:hypothetical protein
MTRLQKSDTIFNMRVNFMRPVHNLGPRYRVTILTRDKWAKCPGTPPMGKGLVRYTDWPRTAEGIGTGVYGQSVNRRLSIPLSKYATVFHAELYAVLACVFEIGTQDFLGEIR